MTHCLLLALAKPERRSTRFKWQRLELKLAKCCSRVDFKMQTHSMQELVGRPGVATGSGGGALGSRGVADPWHSLTCHQWWWWWSPNTCPAFWPVSWAAANATDCHNLCLSCFWLESKIKTAKKPKETYLEAVKSRALYHRVPMKMVWENLRDGANNQS